MLGIIGGVLVVFWFYHAAEKLAKDTTTWAIGGALLYAGTRLLWTYGIIKPLMSKSFYTHSGSTGSIIGISGVAIAILVAAIIKIKYLKAPKT